MGALGLSVGRDASCDVVIAKQDVSRRHGMIRAGRDGYVLLDTSTNGVYLNDARVQTEVKLGRGDTVRFGGEEFRFYAESVAGGEVGDAVPSLQATGTIPAMKRPGALTPPMVNVVAPKAKPALASLQVLNEGAAKGTRYDLTSPLTHVGRGEHNDVAIPDESVSDNHAKLQRREDSWYVVDVNSTNGTYVGGTRLASGDEAAILSGTDLRFGGVKMSFRTAVGTHRPSGETRVIAGVKGPDPKRSEQRLKELAARQESTDKPAESGTPFVALVLLVALVAFIVYVFMQGR